MIKVLEVTWCHKSMAYEETAVIATFQPTPHGLVNAHRMMSLHDHAYKINEPETLFTIELFGEMVEINPWDPCSLVHATRILEQSGAYHAWRERNALVEAIGSKPKQSAESTGGRL